MMNSISTTTAATVTSVTRVLSAIPTVFHRNFGMSSDKLSRRAAERPTDRIFSPRTRRQQWSSKSSGFYMSHEEYQAARRPWTVPVKTQLPLDYRPVSGGSIIQQLRTEEKDRIITEYPRYADKFNSGDRICVTKYTSLTDKSKIERIFGFVISTNRMNSLSAMFTIRNIKLDEPFEMKIPLYSPFIVRIDVLERSQKRFNRSKLYYIRERDRDEYETHLTENLPKSAIGTRIIPKHLHHKLLTKTYLDQQKAAAAAAAAAGNGTATTTSTATESQSASNNPSKKK